MRTFCIALSLLLSVAAGSVSAQNTDLQPAVASDTASGIETAPKRTRRHIDRFVSKGYFGEAEFNLGFYNGNYFRGYGIDVINGYRTSPWFAVGGGVGARYMSLKPGELLIPFYLHLRTEMLDRKVSPYISVNIGGAYMVNWVLLPFAEPCGGISIRLGKGREINIGVRGTIWVIPSFGGAMGCTLSVGYAW